MFNFLKKNKNTDDTLDRLESKAKEDESKGDHISKIERSLAISKNHESKMVLIAGPDPDDQSKAIAELMVDEQFENDQAVRTFIRTLRERAKKEFDLDIDVIYKKLADIQAARDNNATTERDRLGSDTRIKRLARNLFYQAAKEKASDIHIRVEKNVASVRFRVHGLIKEVSQWDAEEGDTFIKTVFTTMAVDTDATMDVHKSQNGRIDNPAYLPPSVSALRMATTSHTDGLYVVYRLLYRQENIKDMDIDSLGYLPKQIKAINKMKQKPTGINIIVGATGSGKSTTLQIVLTRIITDSNGQKNIITVEDPPEYPIFGATQTAVANAKDEIERKSKFNEKITAAMRLDPDIIMLGEIRDGASASLGIRAAMTGHQVWTTLHANSIFGAIDRLIDYDVSLDMLADPQILTGIVYQKLVPILCDGCKKSGKNMDLSPEEIENLERLTYIAKEENLGQTVEEVKSKVFYRGDGCEKCAGGPHGIVGRTVVAEILYPDAKILGMIRRNEKEEARQYWYDVLKGRTVAHQSGIITLSGTTDPLMAEEAVGFFVDSAVD